MQVTLPSANASTAEATATAGTAQAPTASADFAMLLASLLAPVQPGSAATLVATPEESTGEAVEEAPEAAIETAEDTDAPKSAEVAATPVLLMASAMPTPTSTQVPAETAADATAEAVTPTTPKTTQPALVSVTPLPAPEAEAAQPEVPVKSAPTATVSIEPPVTTVEAVPVIAKAVNDAEATVLLVRPEATPANNGSSATFAVEANPAREAAEAVAAKAQPAKAEEFAPQTLPQPQNTARGAAPIAEQPVSVSSSPQVASAVLVAAKSVVVAPVETPDQPAESEPVATTASASAVEPVDAPEALPKAVAEPTKVLMAPRAKAEAPTSAEANVEPLEVAPEPAVVLEKNTAVLAKNALNEHVRGASSRELLAGARETETRADKPAEAAPSVTMPLDATPRVTMRPTVTSVNAMARSSEPPITTTFAEISNEVVKQVSMTSVPGERTLTMKLVPASLGEVGVEMKSTPAELVVRLVSQDASVRDALEHHATGLRETLARDGRETRVEIGSSLMMNMGQSNDSAQGGRATQHDAQERPRFLPPSFYGSEPPQDTIPRGERRTASHNGVLNLFA